MGTSGLHIDKAIAQLNTAGNESVHRCAHFVRLAIEAGGVKLVNFPVSAKDYAPCLSRAGFSNVPPDGYHPIAGDIMVFQPYKPGADGHIQMYNGHQWISDFKQPAHDFWPGPGYRSAKPAFAIFRP